MRRHNVANRLYAAMRGRNAWTDATGRTHFGSPTQNRSHELLVGAVVAAGGVYLGVQALSEPVPMTKRHHFVTISHKQEMDLGNLLSPSYLLEKNKK